MKQITTAGGIIINKQGQVLCTQRDQGKYEYVSFKWEFPGGKLEEGETSEQALLRELVEELNLHVEIKEKFYQVEHDYPDFHLSMAVFTCIPKDDHIEMNVHKQLKWLNPEEMKDLDWAAADKPVADKFISIYAK